MYRSATPAQRTLAAIASVAMVAGVAAAMLFGLRMRLEPGAVPSLIAFSIEAPPRPKPPVDPPRTGSDAPARAASPANLRNRATPVIAVPPAIPLPPPPITAATVAAEGTAGQSGATDIPGAGQGTGGIGNGSGGGGSGGSGTGIAIGPRQIRGRLSVDDFPEGLIGPGERASVGVRYVVEADGRVSSCQVERGSGFAEVDAMACRLISARFRFRPARDRTGQAVRSTVVETHTWFNRPGR